MLSKACSHTSITTMTDSTTSRGRIDRIDAGRDADVRYRSKKLGVAREELLAAVEVAGSRVDDATEHLSKESACGPTS